MMRRVEPRVAAAKRKIQRVGAELPTTLEEFSKRVRARLGKLERSIEEAEVRYRREAARVLRQASHQLGRFEAEGERRWKKLTTEARRDALAVLRKMEKFLESKEPSARRPAPRRKASGRGRRLAAQL